jgi:catechol 2,3-dioxygenase-like lactoylglutathione lyase family enzyme
LQEQGDRGSAGSVVASAVVPFWVLGSAAMAVASARASLGGGAASAAAGAKPVSSTATRMERSAVMGPMLFAAPDGLQTGDDAGMGVEVTGVSELVLEVVDLEASERFYADVLGLPVVERWPDREAIWVMAGDRTRIGLWRPQVGLQGGRGGVHVHFAMHVEADRYDEAAAHLRAQGQDVREEVFGPDHGRALYLDDPDGNVVELWTWDVARHLGTSS